MTQLTQIHATNIDISTGNTGIIANSSGLFVNAAYINTISSNNAYNLNGVPANTYLLANVSANVITTYTFNSNLVIANTGAIVANGSIGTAGQILTSNGTTDYWANPSTLSVNTAEAYAWTNTHSFAANVTIANTAGFIANGSVGTNGQVLASNGSVPYWATVASSVTGSNTQVYFNDSNVTSASAGLVFDKVANNLTVANVVVATGVVVNGAISANGTIGSNNQVLTSNGTISYWANVAPSFTGTNTQVYFNDANTTNAVSTFTFNKVTNNLTVSNTIIATGVTVNGAITANGSLGTNGQILKSNGTATYWANDAYYGSDTQLYFNDGNVTNAIAAFTVSKTTGNMNVSNTVIVQNLQVANSISANGSVGTNGQILTSNGTAAYWAAASVSGANTQVVFNDSGVANGVSAFTFDKAANNLTIANSVIASSLIVNTSISANGSVGTNGQILTSNGIGAYWTSSYTINATPPTNPNNGDLWYDNINGALMVFVNAGTYVFWAQVV